MLFVLVYPVYVYVVPITMTTMEDYPVASAFLVSLFVFNHI